MNKKFREITVSGSEYEMGMQIGEECRDQILALMEHAERLAISQISFAKLGPDYEEAITLLREEILPG